MNPSLGKPELSVFCFKREEEKNPEIYLERLISHPVKKIKENTFVNRFISPSEDIESIFTSGFITHHTIHQRKGNLIFFFDCNEILHIAEKKRDQFFPLFSKFLLHGYQWFPCVEPNPDGTYLLICYSGFASLNHIQKTSDFCTRIIMREIRKINGVWGLGFGVLGFGVWGLGFGVWGFLVLVWFLILA